jgi:(2Fe-2S) ferredoxin
MCRDCCCGTARKHPGVDHDALFERLVAGTAGAAQVDASSCLLACEKSNVVVVQPGAPGRIRGGRPVWLREVLDERTVDAIAAWVHAGGPGLAEPPASLTARLTSPGVLGDAVL